MAKDKDRKKKTPRSAAYPQQLKRPSYNIPVDPQKKPRYAPIARGDYPVWHLGLLDWDGPFGWGLASLREMQELQKILKSFESNTWQELLGQKRSGKKRHHEMPISAICKEAQQRLRDINQEDIDEMFSFHIDGVRRLWGIVDGNILKVLWWDPKHQVYPMNITEN